MTPSAPCTDEQFVEPSPFFTKVELSGVFLQFTLKCVKVLVDAVSESELIVEQQEELHVPHPPHHQPRVPRRP